MFMRTSCSLEVPPLNFLTTVQFFASLVSLLTICRFHPNPVIFTSDMAEATMCKLGTNTHATAQADMAITGCSGYCTGVLISP
jgi:hypothetical protein